MRRGEVYDIRLPLSKGSVQGGRRPCLILQNNLGNRVSHTTIVAPITSRAKKEMPTHVRLTSEDGYCMGCTVLTEQIRTIDKKDVEGFVCELSPPTMERIDEALKISIVLMEEQS